MELFTIDRYTDESEKPKENEKKILKDLLKKIEKRKRKLDDENQIQQNLKVDEIKSKKNSLNVQNDEDDANVDDANIDETNNQCNLLEPILVNKIEENNESMKFQILGDDIFEKKQKVDTFLPSWLSHPTIISSKNIINNDKQFLINEIDNLNNQIVINLKSMGIVNLFPVQQIVIPWLLDVHRNKFEPFRPRDICVSAPTGSGKTLAFAIPITELLLNRVERKIRALIILPVNELAEQVFHVFKKLIEKTVLTICLLSKLHPFAKEQQLLIDEYNEKYYSKVDIVVTTPGRLVEHLHSTKGFNLNDLKFLVIDEADKIMEQIHHNWLYHLDEHVKNTSDYILNGTSMPLCLNELIYSAKQPHKMLFSATLSQDPEKLNNLKLFQPKLFTSVINNYVDKSNDKNLENLNHPSVTKDDDNNIRGEFIGKYTTPAELIEKYCITEIQLKPLTLYSLITENNWKKFLCFTNSADGAHRLTFVLKSLFKNNKKIAELSSSLHQKNRANVLDLFARGKINGIICSDALARGIDIPEVDVVISYDIPRHIKTYIHRIGRTARAGRPGTAITLLAQNELQQIKKILGEVGKDISDEIKIETNMEAHVAKYTEALSALQESLKQEKKLKILTKNLTKNRATNTFENNMPQTSSLMGNLQDQIDSMMVTKLKQKYESIESNQISRKHKKKNENSQKIKELKKLKRKNKLNIKKGKKKAEKKKIK